LQIGQVLQNLVENAIKFNRPGGCVVIGIEPVGERVGVQVRDTGYGIPAADLPHVFERFFTGDKGRTRLTADPDTAENHHLGQSSGLGLAIAAKIIAGHAGVLQVESRPEHGSVFRFEIDRAQDEDPAADQELAGGSRSG